MTNTTLDRFQVLSVNELTYPHKCSVCGSFSGDNGKQYIDFGLFVEYYGNVYICTECFLGAIKSIVHPTEESKSEIRELRAVVTTLISENRILRNGIDDLRDSIVSRTNTNTNHVDVVPSQGVERGSDRRIEEPEISSSDSARANPVGEAREAGSTEQANVEGSAHVRADDSSNSPIIGLDIFDL
jgi:hypothetical protein